MNTFTILKMGYDFKKIAGLGISLGAETPCENLMRFFLFLFISLLTVPSGSWGQVTLGAYCEGDSIRLGVTIFNGYLEDHPEEYRIQVLSNIVGTCEETVTLSHPPLPLPPFLEQATYSFRVPNRDPERYFLYRAEGVDPQGEHFPVYGSGDLHAWDFAGSEEALFVRGSIVELPFAGFAIVPCPESCWTTTFEDCLIDFEQTPPGWEDFLGTGTILDFYGESYTIGMPGAPCGFITRVDLVTSPEGCDTVASEAMPWGTLKAHYR